MRRDASARDSGSTPPARQQPTFLQHPLSRRAEAHDGLFLLRCPQYRKPERDARPVGIRVATARRGRRQQNAASQDGESFFIGFPSYLGASRADLRWARNTLGRNEDVQAHKGTDGVSFATTSREPATLRPRSPSSMKRGFSFMSLLACAFIPL